MPRRASGSGLVGPAGELHVTAASAQLEVPDRAVAVAATLTTSRSTAPSHLAVYPSGTARPLASNADTRLGADVASSVLTPSAPGFTVYNDRGTVLALVDVTGYFVPGP